MTTTYKQLQEILDKNCDSCENKDRCYSHGGSVYHLNIIEVVCKNTEVKEAIKKLKTLQNWDKNE